MSAKEPVIEKLAADYKAKYPNDVIDSGVSAGYSAAQIVGDALKKACEAKDLSREGIITAHRGQKAWSAGYGSTQDFSVFDQPASRESYIVKPDKAALGGSVIYKEPAVSDLAKDYPVPVG
ncbi:ABC transporter substrate-binding protein [Thermocatellispora tengchongensis]